MTEAEMKIQLIQLGAAYGGLLIRVHDMRKEALKAVAVLKQTKGAILKGEGTWPYVLRGIMESIEGLEKEIEKVKP